MKAWPVLVLLALAGGGVTQLSAAATTPVTQAKPPTGEELAQSAGAALIGKYSPPLVLKTMDGQRIDLSKLYGRKPIYLKFWATWCVPCRLQMPHFETVARTRGNDIEVIALNTGFNETPEAVRSYRQTMGLTMPVVIDDGRLADAFHLRVTPQHIVIGRDGRILHVGQQADARLERALNEAVAEPPAEASASVPRPQRQAGDKATAPVLTALSGGPLRLHDRLRPTVIFFFSPWCETYLKTSRPAMAEACLKAREQTVAISNRSRARWIGVAAGLWATEQDLSAYRAQHTVKMPLALDETGKVFRQFRIADVPSFVVVDRSGRVVAHSRNAPEADRAAARLASGGRSSKES